MKRYNGFLATYGDILRVTGIWKIIAVEVIFSAVNAAANIMKLNGTENSMTVGAVVAFAISFEVFAVIVTAAVMSWLKLLFALPKKNRFVVNSFQFSLDVALLLCYCVSAVFYIAAGKYKMLIYELFADIVLYLIAHIIMAALASPKTVLGANTFFSVKSVIIGVSLYIFGVVGVAVKGFVVNIPLGAMFASLFIAVFILAVAVRIAAAFVINKKLRLINVRDTKKTDFSKESYV